MRFSGAKVTDFACICRFVYEGHFNNLAEWDIINTPYWSHVWTLDLRGL
jgi:hypothetical protein